MAPVVPRLKSSCFMFLCVDGPNAPTLRARDLDGHLAHVEAHWQRYLIAGPVREANADAISGSLFLVYAESVDAAWALMRKDPYFTNGQYAHIDARLFSPAIGAAIGGKIWADADSLRARAAGEQSHNARLSSGDK